MGPYQPPSIADHGRPLSISQAQAICAIAHPEQASQNVQQVGFGFMELSWGTE